MEAGISLPLASDEPVYVVLMGMTLDRGNQDPVVVFSRGELCDRLGWDHSGKSYRRLEDSIRRLKAVTITAKYLFRGADGTLYPEVGFGIVSDYAFSDDRRASTRSFIRWSDTLFDSIRAGCLKTLDSAFYLSLSSSTARRLFRYLDKKRYLGMKDGAPRYRRNFQIRTHKLAHEHMFMTADRTAEIRRQLEPAHQELIARGFLDRAEFTDTKSGEAMVTYHFAAGALRQPGKAKKAVIPGADQKSEGKTAREIAQAEREDVDAYIVAHSELLEQARESIRRKIPHGKDGGKAFEAAVRDEARIIARETIGR